MIINKIKIRNNYKSVVYNKKSYYSKLNKKLNKFNHNIFEQLYTSINILKTFNNKNN